MKVLDVESPLNAGVPLSSEASHDKLSESSAKWQVPESTVVISNFFVCNFHLGLRVMLILYNSLQAKPSTGATKQKGYFRSSSWPRSCCCSRLWPHFRHRS